MKCYRLVLIFLQGTISIYASESFSVSKVIKASANNETEEVYHGLTNSGIPIFAVFNKQTGQIICGCSVDSTVYQFEGSAEKSYFSLLKQAHFSSTK